MVCCGRCVAGVASGEARPQAPAGCRSVVPAAQRRISPGAAARCGSSRRCAPTLGGCLGAHGQRTLTRCPAWEPRPSAPRTDPTPAEAPPWASAAARSQRTIPRRPAWEPPASDPRTARARGDVRWTPPEERPRPGQHLPAGTSPTTPTTSRSSETVPGLPGPLPTVRTHRRRGSKTTGRRSPSLPRPAHHVASAWTTRAASRAGRRDAGTRDGGAERAPLRDQGSW